jgi:two-component system sensor histidine kinase BaeS
MTRGPRERAGRPRRARIPVRKRLLVRLLIASVLIAVCSVAATTWLAIETTTRALKEEQGQALADDMDILARLSGYAATHPDWRDVRATVRALSARTGRRIALTTADRTPLADSAPPGTSLPPRAAATVDPLHTDTYSERGAQRTGIDPRAVGPYRLTAPERTALDGLARIRQRCLTRYGLATTVTRVPSGRPVVTEDTGAVGEADLDATDCTDGRLNTPTPTEEKALRALQEQAGGCLTRYSGVPVPRPAPRCTSSWTSPRASSPPSPRSSPRPATPRPCTPPSPASTTPAAPSSTPTSPRSPNCSSAGARATRRPASTCPRPTRRRSPGPRGSSSP